MLSDSAFTEAPACWLAIGFFLVWVGGGVGVGNAVRLAVGFAVVLTVVLTGALVVD